MRNSKISAEKGNIQAAVHLVLAGAPCVSGSYPGLLRSGRAGRSVETLTHYRGALTQLCLRTAGSGIKKIYIPETHLLLQHKT